MTEGYKQKYGPRAADHTGKRFSMWTVKHRAESNKHGGAQWLCVCDCGTEKIVPATTLVQGKSRSCGCSTKLLQSISLTTHGHSRRRGKGFSKTYSSWHAMRCRCLNPKHKQYADYGGRGIRVHETWNKFENFLADMGERPEDKTLDRIDVDGNYEPGNCKWSTQKEQTANRRPLTSHKKLLPLINASRALIAANDNEIPSAIAAVKAALDAIDQKAA